MTYWTAETDARRYARSRPYLHGLVIEKIRTFLKLDKGVSWALDVGCGTGQSATALKAIALRVAGVDLSRAMLRTANDPDVWLILASGEFLPFAEGRFDLTTVALSFHWLRRDHFLPEARRVLRPGGWLIVYDTFFLGQMRANREFDRWAKEQYMARHPAPRRYNQQLTEEEAADFGFCFVDRETFAVDVALSVEQLCSYLMTQTNVLAAVTSGPVTAEETEAWLAHSLTPLFPAPTCSFRFGGYIWYLR